MAPEEVFEKTSAPGTGSATHSPRPNSAGDDAASARGSPNSQPERSLLISVSEGAHSSNILSINLDARHALTPLPRRPLTRHMDFEEGIAKLSAHEHVLPNRGLLEGAALYFGAEDSERGLMAVKQRRASGDTDRTTI